MMLNSFQFNTKQYNGGYASVGTVQSLIIGGAALFLGQIESVKAVGQNDNSVELSQDDNLKAIEIRSM